LETTEAFWAARSMESSLVNRLTWLFLSIESKFVQHKKVLTTASCSFSNCRCKSAAVNGRGCLRGPGPVPTPVLSPTIPPAVPLAIEGILGDAKVREV
jgi:hypothetical protein